MRRPASLVFFVFLAACTTREVRRDAAGPPPDREVRDREEEREGREKGIPAGVVFRWRQRLDEHGNMPDLALLRAKESRDRLMEALPSTAGDGGPRNWTWMGPGNVGGRILGIAIHPSDANTIYVGSASGGIWKTTDGGASWAPQNDFLASLTVGCLALDPTNPNVLYAGTGEGFFDSVQGSSNSAAIQGAGIFKSTDAGAHWTQIPATATTDWYFVNRIVLDPNNPMVLLAATGSGIWRSTDAGATWTRRTTSRTADVEFHPTDSLRAVAGRFDGSAQYSADGGLSWLGATGLPAAKRVELRYARSNPLTIIAGVSGNNDRITIWRSTDGGLTYALRTSGSGIPTYSSYNSALWVDPTNPDLVVGGGVDLFRSTNGGVNLIQISNWSNAPTSAYADHHVVVPHPGFNGTTNKIVFFGTDGGLYRANDVYTASTGGGWTVLNNNLGITQFYGVAINPTSGVLIGGTQDNGTQRFSGNPQAWTRTFGGDGGFCASDPTDPNYFYGEYVSLQIFRSTNGGLSAGYIYSGISEPTANFISHFVLDPQNPNRMLGGGAQLWRSNNVKAAGPTWASIKPALGCFQSEPVPSHFRDNPPCNISTVTIAEGNSDLIWVGHNNGDVYKTTNGTAVNPTWVKMDDGAPGLPNRWISRIALDRADPNRVYVSLMGYTNDNLWRSTNGGATWARITGTVPLALPTAPVSCVTVHRRLPGRLYAGTDVGVYWSEDDGATWLTSNQGPGIAPVDEVLWKNDRTLIAGSHGRGVYSAETWDPASATSVGTGCGSVGTPTLAVTPPQIGTTHNYSLIGAAQNAPLSLIYGAGPSVPTPFPGGCVARINFGGLVVVPAGATGPTGTWNWAVALPNDAALIGIVLTAQNLISVVGGPLLGAAELSNGVELRIGL
jgi:photosystem II stability/assembly factor-like uncharacterized protein